MFVFNTGSLITFSRMFVMTKTMQLIVQIAQLIIWVVTCNWANSQNRGRIFFAGDIYYIITKIEYAFCVVIYNDTNIIIAR